ILAEAQPDLGGTLNLAAKAPRRQSIGDIARWLESEIYAEGVDVRLSCYVTEDDLDGFEADHVIVATGAEPRLDGVQLSHPGRPIEGIGLGHVVSGNGLFTMREVRATSA